MRIKSSVGALLGTCLLVSCGSGGTVLPNIAPEEVLQRSVEASRTLQSSAFNGSADSTVQTQDSGIIVGHLTLDGVLQDAGEQMHVTVEGTVAGGTDERPVGGEGKLELISARNSDTFFFLHSLKTGDEQSLFNPATVEKVAGAWWRIPMQQKGNGSDPITPDPSLLQAQVEVVKVIKEYGIETLDGAQVFHYDVTVDPDLLVAFLRKVSEERGESFDEAAVRQSVEQMQMEGALWINADTYYVHKLKWKIEQGAADARSPQVTIAFEINMRDHNKAEPIILPKQAEQFSPFVLLGGAAGAEQLPSLENLLPAGENSFGGGAFDGFDAMDPQEQQQFLQQFLGGGTMPPLP